MITISLSVRIFQKKNHILEYSKIAYKVDFTCHADFNETREYIKKIGAQHNYIHIIPTSKRNPYEILNQVLYKTGGYAPWTR